MGYTHYFNGLQCNEELADFARTARRPYDKVVTAML